MNFLIGSGKDITFDASILFCEMDYSKRYYLEIKRMLTQCKNVMYDMQLGDSVYIATSPDACFMASDVSTISDMLGTKFGDVGNLVYSLPNYRTYIALNKSEGAIYTRIEYDGVQYWIDFNYYVFDYYDWDAITKDDLYSLNLFGMANTFYVKGNMRESIVVYD